MNKPASIQELVDQTEKLKIYVFETINSYYKEYINTHQYVVDLRDELELLSEAVIEFSAKVQNSDKMNLHGETTNDLMRPNLSKLLETIALLKHLNKMHHLLQNIDQLVEVGEFKAAARALGDMSATLHFLGQVPSSPFTILLHDEFIVKKSLLVNLLDELFSHALKLTQTPTESEIQITYRVTSTLSKTYFENPLSLEEIMGAILFLDADSTKFLMNRLDAFAKNMVEFFVLPLSQNPNMEILQTGNKIHANFKIKSAAMSTTAPPQSGTKATGFHVNDLPQVLEKLLRLGRFLQNHLFSLLPLQSQENTNFTILFSSKWWPLFFSHLYKRILYPSVPTSRAILNKYQESDTLQPLLEFDSEMKSMDLIPRDEYQLVEFVHRIDVECYRKLRTEILEFARDVLVSDDLNTEEVMDATERGGFAALSGAAKGGPSEKGSGKGGKEGLEEHESFYKLPTMHVSRQAQMIVEQAYQILEDASKEEGQSAIELFYCSRDLFDLFRAVMPTQHAELLFTSPERAMIFYNDCHYICYHLTTLAYQYRPALPEPLSLVATFVDMIPDFRSLGQTHFKAMMRRQRDAIEDLWARAGGFKNINEDAKLESVEDIIKSVLYRLGSVSRGWKPIAPAEFYFKTIATIVDVFLNAIINDLTALESLTHEDTYTLRQIMKSLVVPKIKALFLITKTDRKSKVVDQAPMSKYLLHWETFETMVLILSSTPAENSKRATEIPLSSGGSSTPSGPGQEDQWIRKFVKIALHNQSV